MELDTGQIERETGSVTAQSFQSLLFELQDVKITDARGLQIAKDRLEPKVKVLTAGGNNIALDGASIVHHTGAGAVDITGFVAPEPGKARVLIFHNSGAGTVTLRQASGSSSAANRLSLITGADTAKATLTSAIFVYLSSLWRQVL